MSTSQPQEVCSFFVQGRCRFGRNCRKSHTLNEGGNHAQNTTDTHITRTTKKLQTGQGVCFNWAKGRCTWGDRCKFRHDATTPRDGENSRPEGAVEKGKSTRSHPERAQHDAAPKTIQHLASGGTIVKFSAGLAIDRILTGPDASHIHIINLPLETKAAEVLNLLREHARIEEEICYLVDLKPSKGKREKEAHLIIEHGLGQDLEDVTLQVRGHTVTVEMSDSGSGTVEGMNTTNGAVLSISWRIPIARFVVTYLSPEDAAANRSVLSGRVVNGRKIRVQENRVRGRGMGGGPEVDPCSLFVTGLSVDTSVDELQDLLHSAPLSVRKLLGSLGYFDESRVEESVKEEVRGVVGGAEFRPSQMDASEQNRSLRVQFRSWEDAKKVYDALLDKSIPYIGYSAFRLWLPHPYQITIPVQQYRTQKKQWDGLVEGTSTKGTGTSKKDSVLHVREFPDNVVLRVGGDDTKAVGMLKVRVESLVAGETLQGLWHVWFGSAEGRRFLDSVHTATGAYVRHDWRAKGLRVFGDPAAVARAREMMRGEVDRLAGLEYTETLKPRSIRFFIREGVAELKKELGEESVTLNISPYPSRITIRGGADARHLLRTLVDKSLANDLNTAETSATQESEILCPICLMEVSIPVKLGCGHEYCTACLLHFLTADIKTFPVVCIGNEAACNEPIPLSIFQKYLDPPQFSALMETAFTTYIERNQQAYRYCKTPDCKQVYRCDSSSSSSSGKTRQCPSCLAAICIQCHEEGHDGMTCEERQMHAEDRLSDAWAREVGAKKCPSCQVWIEKSAGCNHMTCKLCNTHFCWVCMGVFEPGMIYRHMGEVHGGFFDREEPVVREEDMPGQIREMEMIQNRNRGGGGGLGVDRDAVLVRDPAAYRAEIRALQMYENRNRGGPAPRLDPDLVMFREELAAHNREVRRNVTVGIRQPTAAEAERARRLRREEEERQQRQAQRWRALEREEQNLRRIREQQREGSWCVVM
ncbi:hypothetical protein V5O48_015410 [Marasmius crinis-equi]|uniref:RBR-type E3 ubiquitin transferase n=1 Tax=Marasmius crinis-equi TaxID=585013 RepID=A0ABR3EUK7_9AGAR